MRNGEPSITESDLIAFADGRLDDAQHKAVTDYLASHPDAAEKIEMWRQQTSTLQALYATLPTGPLPSRLDVHAMERRIRDERAAWRRFAAAAVVLLAVGLTGGWFGRGLLMPADAAPDPLLAEATQAHKLYASEVLHPVEVSGTNAPQLKTWLSKRLNRPLDIPDLKAHGFSLVGGRLLPSKEGAAAQLMYQDESGQRVTLYIVPSDDEPETTIRWTHLTTGASGLQALFWNDETIRCAMIGDLPKEHMQVLADETYKQLS
ncbi:anti-sigma factor family protein [Rhizobium paknamense]|uniref:Anti-sigma factor RsiW n=1 Tax=Rhizobium paknamense TaxID=1206817 RepID=A0ABU0IDK0_9HYPH|nr:anti-sigma factor [Rhizobium paknamense]MDQ0456319.1 anti-sigma factor RsiW [Rhizobium paknamense]